MIVKKRIPADTGLDHLTFLNDRKIDGELYAYFQSLSIVRHNDDDSCDTVVLKKAIPKQAEICKTLGIGSPKTYRAHLEYLISRGYIIEEDNGDFFLPNLEEFYFLIPLDTIQFLNDNLKEQVIKVYTYLGIKHQYAQSKGSFYSFTVEEIGEHIGLSMAGNPRAYKTINNVLTCLRNEGFIEFVEYRDGKAPRKRLTKFSFYHKG